MNFTSKMPTVDTLAAENSIYNNYAQGNAERKAEGLAILNIIVKKDGTVRASKPKVKDALTGKAAYVWRMVCFLTSPKAAHKCMPCTCDWDLPVADENGKWRYSLAREMAKDLKAVEDAIVDAIDKSEWHGVHAWGRAFYG
jgi:hypothetical protein